MMRSNQNSIFFLGDLSYQKGIHVGEATRVDCTTVSILSMTSLGQQSDAHCTQPSE